MSAAGFFFLFLGISNPDLSLVQPIFVSGKEARALGHLSQDQVNQISSQSFSERAARHREELEGQRLGLGLSELIRPAPILKASAVLYLLWPQSTKKADCRFCLRAIKSSKWKSRILAGALGVWLGLDFRRAYATSTQDFELAWYREWEAERRQAEAWGYTGAEREFRLAAELLNIQTKSLREQISQELPESLSYLWVPDSFDLSQLGSGFVNQTHILIYDLQNEDSSGLLLRLRFIRTENEAFWQMDHAALISSEQIRSQIVLDPSSASSAYIGRLDFDRFWNLP